MVHRRKGIAQREMPMKAFELLMSSDLVCCLTTGDWKNLAARYGPVNQVLVRRAGSQILACTIKDAQPRRQRSGCKSMLKRRVIRQT